MSLVMWILVFKRGLKHLKCYTDDIFSFSTDGNLAFYFPYNGWMPSEKVAILQLWRKIGLPHKDAKQISGAIIPCIGFDIDPNNIAVSLSSTVACPLCIICKNHRQILLLCEHSHKQ